jgi:hypothetical protein
MNRLVYDRIFHRSKLAKRKEALEVGKAEHSRDVLFITAGVILGACVLRAPLVP